MVHVRDRIRRPASSEHARERRKTSRRMFASAVPGDRFDVAFEWLRAAARYAERRSYRRLETGERALGRREEIRAEAARVVQDAADEIGVLIPASFRPSPMRAEIRTAARKAATPKEQLDLARAWLMHARRLAERYARIDGGTAQARADQVGARAAARLIEWAEEMDADDYGE